jgi:chitinase
LAAGLGVAPHPAGAAPWITGYFPGWEQAAMPATNIDFSTVTHVIHFSVVPNTDGTLDSSANSISTDYSAAVVSAAHAAGRKVLICVGGASSESLFQGATSAATLPVLIGNLTNFMAARGYDGVDIDWEPLPSTDQPPYAKLVSGLRSALNKFPGHKLLTAAAGAYPPYGDSATADYVMFASLQDQFDQINIMTYDLSGPYDGWVTWFNSPIYDGGYRFPSSGGLVPSVDGAVDNFLTNGVTSTKLGVGIAFYGYVWTGGSGTSPTCITGPRQSWTNAPTITAIRYGDILAAYYQSNLYRWDTSAQSAYLEITNANPANNIFLSYDDARTCAAKLSYARNRSLGGLMIWELAQDHEGTQPSPLVQALKQALATPGWTNLQKVGANVSLTFDSIALGSYRVEYTSNLTAAAWNTLLITNVTGAGGPLKIDDPGATTNQPARFYRIQTPP